MATKAQIMNSVGGGGPGTAGNNANGGISTRRGMSAKGRKEAMQHAKEMQLSQTPVKAGQTQGLEMNPNATAAGSMTQTKNLLTKKAAKPAYMQSLSQ